MFQTTNQVFTMRIQWDITICIHLSQFANMFKSPRQRARQIIMCIIELNGPCSTAMLNNQSVSILIYGYGSPLHQNS